MTKEAYKKSKHSESGENSESSGYSESSGDFEASGYFESSGAVYDEMINNTAYVDGAEVTYICDSNYVLTPSSSSVLICNSTGNWSSAVGTCFPSKKNFKLKQDLSCLVAKRLLPFN